MKSLLVFALLFLSCKSIYSQHCPYDGTHLVAITVVDENNKKLTDINTVFYLEEVDNPKADSCTTAAGLIKKQFSNRTIFTKKINERFDRNDYNTDLTDRLEKEGVFTNANMLLTINQAENTCTLIGKSETAYTNYIYQQRKFVITYTVNGKEIQQPLPADSIYSLCKGSEDLKHFKTVTIKL